MAYQWKPISDLPSDWNSISSSELENLSRIWIDHSKKLKDNASLKEFNERLCREWSIETGIIENLYSLDRGVTQLLIEKGIKDNLIPFGSTNKPVEQLIAILRDHENVYQGLFDFVANNRNLSISYIREIHQALTQNQHYVDGIDQFGNDVQVSLARGEWKKNPNNPIRPTHEIHEYCPPEHVQSEMERLIEIHNRHQELKVAPEVSAAWLHHAFAQIHPFQDGNGRVARAIASLVFMRAGLFPLIIHRDIRDKYIDALEEADGGKLENLASLFADIQKSSLTKALSISHDIIEDKRQVSQVIHAAIDRIKARTANTNADYEAIFLTAKELEEMTCNKFKETVKSLNEELKDVGYSANCDRSTKTDSYWFRRQIIEMARQHDYFAETRTYSEWIRLKIKSENNSLFELVISFHAFGYDFLGILCSSAFIEFRGRGEMGETTIEGPFAASPEIFRFYYNNPIEVTERKFNDWLNNVVVAGLDMWRRKI
jgi:Fic family protein